MCNVLVCMAVWMAKAGRGVVDQAVVIVVPVRAFVAAGFGHSIANMDLFPLELLVQRENPPVGASVVTLAGMAGHLLPAIAGNLLGDSVRVRLIHHLIARRERPA